MSAPASVHQSARRRAALIVEREYRPDPARCIAAIVRLLTYRADPSDTPSADDGGAPGAGDQPMHNNDRVSQQPDWTKLYGTGRMTVGRAATGPRAWRQAL